LAREEDQSNKAAHLTRIRAGAAAPFAEGRRSKMEPLTIGIGVAAAGYGCYTGYIRKKAPSKFGKLEAMKKFWGEKVGLSIHFVAYTVMPIVFGLVLIVAGSKGLSIIDVMRK
jgi:hypothetical protein